MNRLFISSFRRSVPIAAAILVVCCVSSQNTFAQDGLSELDDAQRDVVLQATNVREVFEKYGLDLKGEPYQTLWFEEFEVADHGNILQAAVSLYTNTRPEKSDPMRFFLNVIQSKAFRYCVMSQAGFDEAKRSKRLPFGVLDQLDIQSGNIRRVCDSIKKYQAPARTTGG